MHLAVVLAADDFSSLEINLLVDGDHHAHLEELGNDFTRLQVHLFSKIADGDYFHHINNLGNRCELCSSLLLSSLNLELFLFLGIPFLIGSLILLLGEGFLGSSLIQRIHILRAGSS